MTIEELNKQIKSNEALLVYFSGENCSVCQVLKPKIFEAFFTKYPKINQLEIDIQNNLELSRHFGVFAMPTILIFFDGQEFQRKERNISVEGFIDDVKRPYEMFFN
jgi:thioredoxin 1